MNLLFSTLALLGVFLPVSDCQPTHAFASEVFQEFHCQVIQAWVKAEESRKPEAVFGNYLSSDSR